VETALRIELGDTADKLEIPWASPQDPTNRYHDLKAHPELLEHVVEARESLPLRDFLRSINAADTQFTTAKCGIWSTSSFDPQEQARFPSARSKFSSYIDLVFARPEFNFDRLPYEQLARRLAERLAPEPARARVEFCLRHCLYAELNAWGFYLTMFLDGYGVEPEEAGRAWADGLVALQNALLCISEILNRLLRQGGRAAC
jgi:hypothetical protein